MEKPLSKYISKYNFVVNEMVQTKTKSLEYFLGLCKVYNKFKNLNVVDTGSVLIVDRQVYKIPTRYSPDDNNKLKRNFIRKFLLTKYTQSVIIQKLESNETR